MRARVWGWSAGAALLGIVAVAGPAYAHSLGPAVAGFSSGLAHPLLGLDHLLAMIAVGLWASQIAERTGRALALAAVPAAFVAALAGGALAGFLGVELAAVELGVLGSVVVLGLLVALAPGLPVAVGVVVAAAFAVFHGYAHAGELPEGASAPLYALGFLLATAALHAVGVALGLLLQGDRALAPRLGGAGIAVAGMALYILS